MFLLFNSVILQLNVQLMFGKVRKRPMVRLKKNLTFLEQEEVKDPFFYKPQLKPSPVMNTLFSSELFVSGMAYQQTF